MEKCICGHKKLSHYEPNLKYFYVVCRIWTGTDYCDCKGFKLDNLQVIEDLAKEKNII